MCLCVMCFACVGWCPESYDVPDEPAYQWLKRVPKGRSVTELEMWHGALRNPAASKAFFYLRDPALVREVPETHRKSFESESASVAAASACVTTPPSGVASSTASPSPRHSMPSRRPSSTISGPQFSRFAALLFV
jgi:hypothetical protein